MLAMPIAVSQTTAIRQSYQLVTVSSRTYYSAVCSWFFGKQETATDCKSENLFGVRGSRGSDPRLLRLTMDGLLDRHIWGATPCIKHRPRRKVRLDEARSCCRQN